MELYEFAQEAGEEMAALNQNINRFFVAMQELYARQRGDDRTRRDCVPTRDDAVFLVLERWRDTHGFVGNTYEQRKGFITELEALLAPAPVEPEFSVSAAVCKAIINGERFKQLAKDIDDVLITLTDDDKTFDRRRAASRLIMSMIERFTVNE